MTAEDKLQRNLCIYVITIVLEKKNWEYEYKDKEVYLILGNREISTEGMTNEELDELLTEIINW